MWCRACSVHANLHVSTSYKLLDAKIRSTSLLCGPLVYTEIFLKFGTPTPEHHRGLTVLVCLENAEAHGSNTLKKCI